MQNIYKLEGSLQHYIWGGKDYIPELLNIEKNHSHYAELWLGGHISSPSLLRTKIGKISLIDFLDKNPDALGEKSRQIFGNYLPYLLKILDVKQPLSIQLHPTKKQAEAGFAEESAKGIPLTDPIRTYKDNNHKPEMMIALSDFWLLHGFKAKHKIIEDLEKRSSLKILADKLHKEKLDIFYKYVMEAEQAHLEKWLLPIIKENKNKQLSSNNPDYWVCYTFDAMKMDETSLDAGLICFYLFNIVKLKKGEGIFQDAGIPHAYLRGQNIELMACSDNVIRGGLTAKHIDISALLNTIDYREIEPNILSQAPKGKYIYPTRGKDFALQNLEYLKDEIYQNTAQNAEILLVIQGCVKITTAKTALILTKGESIFITATTNYQIEGIETGNLIVAMLP